MHKFFFVFLLSLLVMNVCKAAKLDSLRFYLKNSGRVVSNKDSADFFRLIEPPDTNIDRDLYRIYDYYPDGKPKMIATSLSADVNLALDGSCINFFKNGRRQSIIQFKNGRLMGNATYYYPSGKLYAIFKIGDNGGYFSSFYNGYIPYNKYGYYAKIVELRDTTGKLLAANGKGHVIIFDTDFKNVVFEGDIKNDKKNGEWNGKIGDTAQFKCMFHNDDLKSGNTYTRSGKRYTFKEIEVKPQFSDGTDAFYLFIKKNLQYPAAARAHRARGIVIVKFFVETDGSISDVKVVSRVVKDLDDEALRVIRLSPPWIPATIYGIPVRSTYTINVNFYNVD
jgi:TonB family protein